MIRRIQCGRVPYEFQRIQILLSQGSQSHSVIKNKIKNHETPNKCSFCINKQPIKTDTQLLFLNTL